MNIIKIINSYSNRWWINKSTIWKLACTITSIIFTLWGFISLFNPLDGVFHDNTSLLCKLLIGILILLIVFIFSSIIATFLVFYTNQVCIGESSTKNKVYVKYGDIYSPQILEGDATQKRAIVVSVNRCFDTIVDDHLVSHNTQHGKVFQRLYDNHQYTPKSLNLTISNILKHNTAYKELTNKEKPEGNRKRYDVGTIVNLQVDANLSYYLLGFSHFDEHLNAHSSKADFVLAVQQLIEFCNQNSQGYPVILPLLGSGLSRTNIELKNILHYLANAFAINKHIINNDFYIVVWEGDRDRISIKELRKW